MPVAPTLGRSWIIGVLLFTFSMGHAAYAATGNEKATGTTAAEKTAPVAEPANAAGSQTPEGQVDELRRRVEILAAEVEKLRSGEVETVVVTEQERRSLGVAPSAAATYRRRTEGVSLAGYDLSLNVVADIFVNVTHCSGVTGLAVVFVRHSSPV